MRGLNWMWIVLLMMLVAITMPVDAEETAPDDAETTGVFTLGEVVVTAQGETQMGSVDRVDEETMREFNRDDLTEALDLMPGVTVSRTGARNERTVQVRGFDVKRVPLFMDGIPIYVMYDGYSDLGRFTTFDVSQIEVSKGAASVLYGFNTLGGAINVVTKRPEKPIEANAGVGLASGDTTTAYANIGSNLGKWYLQGGASYSDRDYYKLSDDFEPTETEDGDKRDNAYQTDKKISFKVGFRPTGDDEYAISYSKQEGEKGNPVYTGYDDTQRTRYWQWPQWDKESYYVNSKTGIGDQSYVKTRVYYDKYDNSLFAYDDDTYSTQNNRSAFKSWYNDDTYGGSVELGTTLLNRNDLKAALHYKRDRHQEHDNDEPKRTFRDEYYSIGVEDTVSVIEKLSARVGASYDWQKALEAEDYDSDTGIISDQETKDASAFNPQAGLFYDFSDASSAYLTVARKSRFATMKDRYSYRFGTTLPNPDLDPEIAVNYDLGFETALDRVTFGGALFFSDIKDYIQLATIPDPDDATATIQQNQNIGNVQIYGVEASLTVRITDSLRGGVNYTYTEWDNRSNDDKLIDIPEHKFVAYAIYSLFDRLDLSADSTTYSGRYSSSNGVRETDTFTVLNAKAALSLIGGLAVEAGVNNLLDENYEIEEGYPEEGINYFTNLTYKF
jgi:iron complex outermembrane recepter protein